MLVCGGWVFPASTIQHSVEKGKQKKLNTFLEKPVLPTPLPTTTDKDDMKLLIGSNLLKWLNRKLCKPGPIHNTSPNQESCVCFCGFIDNCSKMSKMTLPRFSLSPYEGRGSSNVRPPPANGVPHLPFLGSFNHSGTRSPAKLLWRLSSKDAFRGITLS